MPCHDLGQDARSDAEGGLDNPSLADNAAPEGEQFGLTLAQRAHHLEALDRGVGVFIVLSPRTGRMSCLSLPWSISMTLLRYFTCPRP